MVHRKLDEFAQRSCPGIGQFGLSCHWSLDQVEAATVVVFARQSGLQAINGRLTRTAIHPVKPENVATFPWRKLGDNYQDEMGNRFNTRLEGTRTRHTMGPVPIKMHAKLRLILRIETSVVNVCFFKHYREVEHKDGRRSRARAEGEKTIYSLAPLRELLLAANRRYPEFVSAIEDDEAGTDELNRISRPAQDHDRRCRDFNYIDPQDDKLFQTPGSGEFNISGFQHKELRRRLKGPTGGRISRTIRPLRLHGLVKKVSRTDNYYLTLLGKQVVTLGLKLKELSIIPALLLAPAQ
jgi:hypothetical protein